MLKNLKIFLLALAALLLVKGAMILVSGGNPQSGLNFLRPVDDAYISHRYAENLAEGRGLVYNEGERVEGGTTFFFIALLALFGLPGIPRLDIVAVVLGLIATALLVMLVWRFMKSKRAGPAALPEKFILIYLCAGVTALVWSWSGMETPILALIVFAAFAGHLREIEGKRLPVFSAVLTALAGMTHPEAILIATVLGMSWLIPFNKKRLALGILYGAIVVALFGGYWLWRWRYFGHLMPNTFYAKAAGGGLAMAKSGLVYVRVGLFSAVLPMALAAFAHSGFGARGKLFFAGMGFMLFIIIFQNLALFACLAALIWWISKHKAEVKEQPRWVWLFSCYTFIHLIAVIKVGGDFYPFHRFIWPILPLSLLVIWKFWRDALDKAAKKASDEPTKRPEISIAKIALIIMAINLWSYAYTFQGFIHSELQRVVRNFADVGRTLRKDMPAGATVATLPIGALGYFSKLRIHDMMGLVDEHIAHIDMDPTRGIIGHSKFDHAYTFSLRPEAVIVLPSIYRDDEKGFKKWIDENALAPTQYRIYEQPALRDEYQLVKLPVKKGWAAFGFLRKDLVGDTLYSAFYAMDDQQTEAAFKTPERAAAHPLHGKTFGIWSFK